MAFGRFLKLSLLLLALTVPAVRCHAWGPIKHMTILEEVIRHPDLDPEIRRTMEENLKYAKGGSVGPDLGNFDLRWNSANASHYCCSADLARRMLQVARDPKEKAFAYGWIVHVAADSAGHPWVNSQVCRILGDRPGGCVYTPGNKEITRAHQGVEAMADCLNQVRYGKPVEDPEFGILLGYRYDMGFRVPPSYMLGYREQYCDRNRVRGDVGLYARFVWFLYADSLFYAPCQDSPKTPSYETAFEDSIRRAVDILNSNGKNARNWDLDNGEEIDSPTGRCEDYQKCVERGNLKSCGPAERAIRRPDRPDEFESVVTRGEEPSEEPWTDAGLYRLAAKKGKGWVLWHMEAEQLLREYEALPEDAPWSAIRDVLERMGALVRELNDPFNFREFSQNNSVISAHFDETPDVAMLENGYFEEMSSMMAGWSEPVLLLDTSFSPDIVAHHPVLVIPSGGLFGLERSEFFRGQLEEYVKAGGTLVVFAQQHGYEYSVLPVPREGDGSYRRVHGVGWAEDISCFFAAAHINEWHQVLSGLRRNSPTLSVDGFITEYPSNSRLLLKRNKNGYPVLLMYEYGLGRVIVTTMYSDSAYGQGQASSEELAIVRDIIAWAKSPGDLPEASPGGVVEFPIEVVNRSGREASSVRLLVFAPGRGTLVAEHVKPLSLGPGMSANVAFSFATDSRSPLGIYHVDYLLMDAAGGVVQPQSETDSGRFVVADPPSPGYQGCGLTFSLASDADGYLSGTTATLTATVHNATGEARRLTALFEGQGQEVSVPAKGSASAVFTKVVGGWGDYRVSFYEGKEYRGWASKRCGGYSPSATVGIKGEKAIYRLGESVSLRATLRNGIPLDWEARVKISVRGPDWREAFAQEGRFVFPLGGGEGEIRVELPLSATSLSGSYCTSVEVCYGDRLIAAGHGRFEVLRSQVAVTPMLPELFRLGRNEVGFRLVNMGKVDVGSGVLDVILRDPRGRTVWNEEFPFSLRVGEEAILAACVSLSSLEFGTYTLLYAQRDESGSGVPFHRHIINRGQISASLDRASYNVREVAALRVNVANLGSFSWEGALLNVSVEDMGFGETHEVSVPPGQSHSFEVSIPIGEAAFPGRHKVDVGLRISSGALLFASRSFLVPASHLVLRSSGGPLLAPGDAITLSLENRGGVDTTYRTERLRVTDLQGTAIWNGEVWGSVRSMEEKTLVAIHIPQQAASGKAILEVLLRDEGRGDDAHLLEPLQIAGLAAALETRTEQDVYLVEDPVLARTSLCNGPLPIQGGTLRVVASRIAPTGILGFEAMYPGSGFNKWTSQPLAVAVGPDGVVRVVEPDRDRLWWRRAQGGSGWEELWDDLMAPAGIAVSADGRMYVADPARGEVLEYEGGPMGWGFGAGFEFSEPAGVALGPDGRLYVADAGLHKVFGFDREGNLLVQWGEEGEGQGQMSSPRGIAVSADGHVYVADTGNHRIQVFDAEGRYLGAWGGRGAGKGEFLSPQGVAVGPDGSLYVADTGNHRVQRLDPQGGFICAWGGEGAGDGQLRSPRGIAVGADGIVYVADTSNSRVQAFDEGGILLFSWMIGYCDPTCGQGCEERELGHCYHDEDLWPFEWGSAMIALADGSFYAINPRHHQIQKLDFSFPWEPVVLEWGGRGAGQGEFEDPKGLALGPDRSIYVADTGNHRIQVFDKDGNFLCGWGEEGEGEGEFRFPEGVAVGGDGSVYVADTGNHRIQVFDAQGAFLAKWGGQGDALGEFYFPKGVSVGLSGQLYVADTGNHRIQRFTGRGLPLGAWGGEGSGDGEFAFPTALAVGPFGFVYVVDQGNRRIQRFDRDGNFAGAWGCYDCGYEMETCEGNFGDIAALCVSPDGRVYVADPEGIYASLNEDEAANVVFEAEYPVDLAPGGTQDFASPIGRLVAPGAYLLEATLWNGLGQGLAKGDYRFFVASEDLVLRIQTDKAVYRVGETVMVLGTVENRSPVAASGLWLELVAQHSEGGSQGLLSQPLELPPGGGLPISVAMTALRDGRVHLSGLLARGGRTLVEVVGRFDIEAPRVAHSLELPQAVGNEPFPLRVGLWNLGRLPVSVGVEIRDDEGRLLLGRALTLSGGEEGLLEVMHQVRRDTAFFLSVSGDVSRGDTAAVTYGLGASISLSPSHVYGEGPVAVPMTITNTGSLDETATVVFRCTPGGGDILRTYALSPGETLMDLLDFILPEGDYVLFASSEGPFAEAQAALQVRREGRVGLSLAVGRAAGGLMPVGVVVSNLGSSELAVELSSGVRDGAGSLVWSGLEGVGGLSAGASREIQYLVPVMALGPGHYTLEVEALNGEGKALASQGASFTVSAHLMEAVQTPPHQEFQPGQEGLFSFRVRNSGDHEGSFSLKFMAEGVVEATHSGWLGPGEEKEVVFSGILPEDLEERELFGIWELTSPGGVDKGVVRFRVRGVALSVTASLDKPTYREGDVARLSLLIQSPSPTGILLLARVNYGAFEEQRPFELAPSQSMVFDVPLFGLTGGRLFYGIYHSSGRSIHLNSLHVHRVEGPLSITTDKEMYRPGEAVVVSVEAQASGTMTLKGPGGYSEVFAFSGSATRGLVLPDLMVAGTYAITAELQAAGSEWFCARRLVDVAGIDVKVKEASLDKARYDPMDVVELTVRLEGNQALGCSLRAWFLDPHGQYSPVGEAWVSLSDAGPVLVGLRAGLSTSILGMHRLVYGVYLGDVVLCSGSEAFDVGGAVLLGLRTDKTEYALGTEPVEVEATLLGVGQGTIELFLDGVSQGAVPVRLEGGLSCWPLTLTPTSPGRHRLDAVLNVEGLTSTKGTGFSYGTGLPDLTVDLWGSLEEGGESSSATLTLVARNVGKGISGPTSVVVSQAEGTQPVGTWEVGALGPGEGMSISQSISLSGGPGPMALTARIDPQDRVREYDEDNNESYLLLTVPELSLLTVTDKNSYGLGETVLITARIHNHGPSPLQGLLLETVVKDPRGEEVLALCQGFDLGASSQLALETAWVTQLGYALGPYSIEQRVVDRAVSSRRVVILGAGQDFSIETDSPLREVELGGEAEFVLRVAGVGGFSGEVGLSLVGGPSDCMVYFVPNPVLVSGGGAVVVLRVMTTIRTVAGSYGMKVVGRWEGVVHEVDLTLHVVGFDVRVEPRVRGVRQLESAVFDVEVLCLGGYRGEVFLGVEGVPRGMRATLSRDVMVPPGEVELEVETSKWVVPGRYELVLAARGRVCSREVVVVLDVEGNPALSPGIVTVPGGSRGVPLVRVYGVDGVLRGEFLAFVAGHGGAVAAGDIDGDGLDEVVVGTVGRRGRALLGAFGMGGESLGAVEVGHGDKRAPLSVVCGDLDGDWVEEVVVGSYEPSRKGGGRGVVRVYRFVGSRFVETGIVVYPYGGYRKAPQVAVGDVDGDGRGELIVVPGGDRGASAYVKVFAVDTADGSGRWSAHQVMEMIVDPGGYGANVASCDMDGDGRDEVVLGAGPGPRRGSEVMVIGSGDGVLYLKGGFEAYPGGRYGVLVSCGDTDGDGLAEVITGPGPGPGNPPLVRIFGQDGELREEFMAYPLPMTQGVRPATARIGH